MNQSATNQGAKTSAKPGEQATRNEASDLAAQLDALLAREADAPAGDAPVAPPPPTFAESAPASPPQEAAAPPPPPASPPPSSPSSSLPPLEDAPSEQPATSGSESDALGADLADQIQSLLDEADPTADDELVGTFESPQQLEAMADPDPALDPATEASPEPDAAEAEPSPPVAPPLAEASVAPAAPAPATASSPDQPNVEPPASSAVDASAEGESTDEESSDDAVLIEQIDKMLAEQADESVGDIQAVEPEPATESTAPMEPTAEQQASADPPADAVAAQVNAPAEAVSDEIEGGFESPDDLLEDDIASTDAAIAAEAADDDDDWSFESPPEVATTEAGTAADVAAELDDQPEARPAAAATDETNDEAEADVVVTASGWQRQVDRLEWVARHSCALVNRPLEYVGPENRRLVGYAAILTTAANLLVVIFGLLS